MSEEVLFASFMVLMVVTSVLMLSHRILARYLVKDPEKRPQRSVELAKFWPSIVLAIAFPLWSLLSPWQNVEEGAGVAAWMMVGFFGFGVFWFGVARKWDWYLRYASNTAFAVTRGSREHGETPEMYRDAFQRALPWATVLMAVAFVIALIRALLHL